MADRRRWMFCYREGVSYAWINTNNYIESWHNALKKHFFKDKQQRRIDSVIYILVYKAIPHYQQMCIRHTVQVGKMTPAAKKALRVKITAMNHLEEARAKDPNILLIHQPADSSLMRVRSFSDPSIHYDIKIDWTQGAAGVLSKCSCADFTSNKMCCKHIDMVLIELRGCIFQYDGNWEPQDKSPEQNEQEDGDFTDNINPLAATVTSTQLCSYYIQGLSNALNIADMDQGVSNEDEVLKALRLAHELFTANIRVQDTHGLKQKTPTAEAINKVLTNEIAPKETLKMILQNQHSSKNCQLPAS